MIKKIKDKTSYLSFSSLQIRLSPLHYTSDWLFFCMFKWGAPHFYLYSFIHLTFHSTKSAPLKLNGSTSLGGIKTTHYYILEGANDLTYNGGIFLMTLYWPSTILMILPIGTLGYSKRIHFDVTIIQHSPLTRRVFYNNNNISRRRRESIFNIIMVIHL